MSIHKADYRTNRADYAIAAKLGREIADSDRDEILARKKKSLWLSRSAIRQIGGKPVGKLARSKSQTARLARRRFAVLPTE